MELPHSKRKQTAHRKKRKVPKVEIKEDAIQGQCDDLLVALRLKSLRIPDYVWTWLSFNAPVEIRKALSDSFKGMPDNMVLSKLSDRYTICMGLELKTVAGNLSKKQKDWQRDNGGVVSRSPDDTIKEVYKFQKDAAILRKLIKESEVEL